MILKKPGIYAIINVTKLKIYIGSSVNVNRRCYQHMKNLQSGKSSKCMQDDYASGDELRFVPLSYFDDLSSEKLFSVEKGFIDSIKPELLYNSSSGVIRRGWGRGIMSIDEKRRLHEEGKRITTDAVASLCGALRCQPGDILEYVECEE